MRFLLFLMILLACLSFGEAGPFRCSAIQSDHGTFIGVMVNMKGKRVRGTSVTITGVGLPRNVTPNRDGYFAVELPPGIYEITVTYKNPVKKTGLATYSLTEVVIKSGGEYSHVFRLEPVHQWTFEDGVVQEPIKDP